MVLCHTHELCICCSKEWKQLHGSKWQIQHFSSVFLHVKRIMVHFVAHWPVYLWNISNERSLRYTRSPFWREEEWEVPPLFQSDESVNSPCSLSFEREIIRYVRGYTIRHSFSHLFNGLEFPSSTRSLPYSHTLPSLLPISLLYFPSFALHRILSAYDGRLMLHLCSSSFGYWTHCITFPKVLYLDWSIWTTIVP